MPTLLRSSLGEDQTIVSAPLTEAERRIVDRVQATECSDCARGARLVRRLSQFALLLW
jgi:hypothetical protein